MWIKIIFLVACCSYVSGISILPKVMRIVVIKEENSTQQHYSILRDYIPAIARNVRWESRATNLLDERGNPVPQVYGPFGEFACIDFEGNHQMSGAEYTRPSGRFIYRCEEGIEEIVACQGSPRVEEQWIPVGETMMVNGFWHKCELYKNTSVIYTQEKSCIYKGREYHIGEEIRVGFVRMTCELTGYKVIGCYFLDEQNRQVPLERGQKKEIGSVIHSCDDKKNLPITVGKAVCDTAVLHNSGYMKNRKDYNERNGIRQNYLKCKYRMTVNV
ncbi:hypothetical protein FO519_006641 [Halicephalobus sp. NKZ332]|nr:hypothetical protein FO519_006641 [Halicephalobus sp. NKZ332]